MITIFKFNKQNNNKPCSINNKLSSRQVPISSNVFECETFIKEALNNSPDIVVQVFLTQKEKAMIAYIDGLSNTDLVDRDVVAPLKSNNFDGNIALALNSVYKEVFDFQSSIEEILRGNVVLFYENSNKALIIELKQWDKRTIEVPDSEAVIRGPREGFTESIRTNTALIRRKLKTPNLVIENYIKGKQTNTLIGIVYIKGIVNEDVLNELKIRLARINTDSILESGEIEQFIEENPFSLISGIGVTQKPDNVAAKILEGRVAIFCDGTPHVLLIPELFIENIQKSEDSYNRILISFVMRCLRLLGFFIAVMIPGLAVAVITYNQEMMPTVFLTSLISSTEYTPMPAAAEIFLLIILFEMIKEAGTRLPKVVGSAVTIVGSLIIGDAAVNAGIVGAPMVIIVALTAITSFMLPNLNEFIIVYRFFFLFLGSTMGLIGFGGGIIIMLTQLISTKSFGIPILSSFSKNEMKDSIIRFPIKYLKYRPSSIVKNNIKRRK